MTEPLKPQLGDYVLATKWSDGDPGDPWAVGFYAGLDTFVPSSPRHMVKDAKGEIIRANGYRRVGRITHDIGKWLLENADRLESAPRKINLWGMYDWESVNERIKEPT